MPLYAVVQASKTLMQCRTCGDTAWVTTKPSLGRIMYMGVCHGRISTSANRIRRTFRNCTVDVLSFFKSCMTLSKASESWWTSHYFPIGFAVFGMCLMYRSVRWLFCCRILLQGRLNLAYLAMSGHTVEHAAGGCNYFENPPELAFCC